MNSVKIHTISAALLFLFMGIAGVANAAPFIQCPGDILMPTADGLGVEPGRDGIPDEFLADGITANPEYDPGVVCVHVSAGDGYVTMADDAEKLQYFFSYADLTGTREPDSITNGLLAATFPAPTIIVDEGDELYLSMTNVGMVNRPDLFDTHTIHFHGFPEAMDTMDGVPTTSISINERATLTYYYNIVEPGTYAYHCHVEATEHMQMGMLANLYVRPAQNRLPDGTVLWGDPSDFLNPPRVHSNPDWDATPTSDDATVGDKYLLNDEDGSTYYDVEALLQLGSWDPEFHDASMNTQPLPFQDMLDTFHMINGRGYPDTVDPRTDTFPAPAEVPPSVGATQNMHALVSVQQGQILLLRITNLNITTFHTMRTLGLTMKVVARGSRLQRGPDPDGPGAWPSLLGKDLSYNTESIMLGGGEAYDVIIDTTDVPPGDYYFYTTNLHYLSNNTEDFGGAMTYITVTP